MGPRNSKKDLYQSKTHKIKRKISRDKKDDHTSPISPESSGNHSNYSHSSPTRNIINTHKKNSNSDSRSPPPPPPPPMIQSLADFRDSQNMTQQQQQSLPSHQSTIPPFMINNLSKASFSSVDSRNSFSSVSS